eukprot:gb/GECH01002970.1/.p1 GENE.gb/GECH01002970.1/~~gb/GECH01002970.1/.p1  ORF type:complete len:229 (+),score=41.52 gb/GECH01002970.1/:1-687(+)
MEEAPRTSLLDVILDRAKDSSDKDILSRMIYCSETLKGEGITPKELHEEVMESSPVLKQNCYGILIQYQQACLHFLEAPSEVLVQFLNTLYNHRKTATTLHRINVLLYTDDVKCSFPRWLTLTISSRLHDAEEESQELESEVANLSSQCLNLGELLMGKESTQINHTLDNIHVINSKVIPTSFRVLELSRNSQQTMRIDEFLYVFDQDIALDLESNHEWPIKNTTAPF